LPINTESVITTATKTPKSSLRWLLTINFFVYVVLLTARSWGSHRILHYEETISVASALSQSFFATLNDVAYGTLVPRILIFLAVQLPLEYLPITLLTIATFLWAIFSTIIFWVVYKKTHRYLPAFLASLVLILVPLPELGMQGIVWNSFWPMFIALGVVVACRAYGESTRTTYLVALFAFLTAASNPVAGVLVLLLGFDYICHKALRKRVLVVSVGLFVGMVFSLFVQINQEPPLRYLGEWTQELAQTSETLGRLEDSGAATVRKAPPIDVIEIAKSSPATIKYLLTQMMPEPYASRWILTDSWAVSLAQVLLILSILGACPLIVLNLRKRHSENTFVRDSFFRITVALISILVFQSLIIGDIVQSKQYLFAPVSFYWIGVFLLTPQNTRFDLKKTAVFHILFSLLVVIAMTKIAQNFRDPHDVSGEDGAPGRYEENQLWRIALNKALAECRSLNLNDVVVITQKDSVVVDAPVVIRCKFITR
jgi:hypothetical protein